MPGSSLIRSTKKLCRWRTLAILAVVVGASAPASAHADTIVLKNGRRIVGESVTREYGKVSCETPAGRITISESLVLRIEKDDLPAAVYPPPNASAANLAIAPPASPFKEDERPGMEPVAREAVHDGAIDRAALARFEAAAAQVSEGGIARRNRGFRCAVVQAMRAAGCSGHVGHLGILLCGSRFLVQEKSYHFGWGRLQARAVNLPLLFEVSSIDERFLGPHFSGG